MVHKVISYPFCSFLFPYQSGIQGLRSFSDRGKCLEMTLEIRISAKGEKKEKRKIHRDCTGMRQMRQIFIDVVSFYPNSFASQKLSFPFYRQAN